MGAVVELWDAFTRVSERTIERELMAGDVLAHLREFPEAYGELSDRELIETWLDERWPTFERDFFENAEEEDGKLVVYRCLGIVDPYEFAFMVASGVTDPKYAGIGIFWAWNQDLAECHWGEGPQEVLVKGRVRLSAIDIPETLLKNLDPGLGEEEAEILLKKGAPVEILAIGIKKIGEVEWIERGVDRPMAVTA